MKLGAFILTAVEEAHGAGAAEAGSAGLPQFDPSSWPSQLFWLALSFGVPPANASAMVHLAEVVTTGTWTDAFALLPGQFLALHQHEIGGHHLLRLRVADPHHHLRYEF